MDQAVVYKQLGVAKNSKTSFFNSSYFKFDAILPLSAFVLIDADPECRKEVEMPTYSFNPSHETEIHESFVEDVAGDGSPEENVKELVVRLVEALDGQIKLLIDPFHVRKCLSSRDVHLDHWTRWSRNIFRPRLPCGWRRVLS